MERNQSLTVVRALAALAVFISHAANDGLAPPILGFGLGQLGVMLFFALSGFLMTAIYIDRPYSRQSVADFARARAGRVVPLFWAVALLSIPLSFLPGDLWHYQLTEPLVVLGALSFIQAPYELWSIPVEVQYYVLFVLIWLVSGLIKSWAEKVPDERWVSTSSASISLSSSSRIRRAS